MACSVLGPLAHDICNDMNTFNDNAWPCQGTCDCEMLLYRINSKTCPRTDTTHCPISRYQLQRRSQPIGIRYPCLLIPLLSCGNSSSRADGNNGAAGRSFSSRDEAGLREACYHAKAAAFQAG